MITITFPTLRATVQVDERHPFRPGSAYEIKALAVPDGSVIFHMLWRESDEIVHLVASSSSAQALSKLAFDRGAEGVHHLYDLKLAEVR